MRFLLMFLLAFAAICSTPSLADEPSLLWGGLAPGPYTVGFITLHERDYSRVYRDKHDAPDLEGRARPIRISIWYPAAGAGEPMHYRDYAKPRSDRTADLPVEKLLADREALLLGKILIGEPARTELMNTGVGARYGARAATARFPLVLYSAGWNEFLQHPNFVLAEYLASHGYVVATVPQLPSFAIDDSLGLDQESLDTQVRDLEFAMARVRKLPYVSRTSLATMGHSMGGVAAMVLQMRNRDVDAVVGLDTSYGGKLVSTLVNAPAYHKERMRVPLLDIRRADPEWDLTTIDSFSLSHRYYFQLTGVQHADFTSYPEIAMRFPTDIQGRTPQQASRAYELMCRTILAFLDSTVKHERSAQKVLLSSARQEPVASFREQPSEGGR